MEDQRTWILDLVAEGRLSVDEAVQLIELLDEFEPALEPDEGQTELRAVFSRN